MADPIEFDGSNGVYRGQPGDDTVQDLPVFKNRGMVVSIWQLRPEELEEVARTGLVVLGIFGEQVPPVIVGSAATVRGMAADYGEVW